MSKLKQPRAPHGLINRWITRFHDRVRGARVKVSARHGAAGRATVLYYSAVALLLLSGTNACNAAPAAPTRAPAPSARAAVVTAPAAATLTPRPTIAPTALPSPSATYTPNPNALVVQTTLTNLRSSEIAFIAYVLPNAAPVTRATVAYTFRSGQNGAKTAVIPAQTVGKPTRFEITLPIDRMPVNDDGLSYNWSFVDAFGNQQSSDTGTFKITEATRSEMRDELPIVKAKQTFASKFPVQALFTVSLTPEVPITNARFFITQNSGIVVEDYNVPVKSLAKGDPVSLSFSWNQAFSQQIPWQQFETWWVFTDEFGKVTRTDHAFNDYADTKHPWRKTETKYAVLYTYNQSGANVASLAAATDHSIEALSAEFGYKLLYHPHIVVYNSFRDFRDWATAGAQEGGFIGMASGQWGGAVVAVYNSIRFTGYSIIKHELTHLFQFQSIQKSMPQWFIEGSARAMEEIPETDNEAAVRKYVKQFGAPSLQLALPMVSSDGSIEALPYYVGMTFIRFLKEKYGPDAFAKIHIALARNDELSDAFKAATNHTLAELDKQWAAWIAQ